MIRRTICLVFAVLALPSAASAETFDYAAPTASISRGAPLTFAVRTIAPPGSVVVRVSGRDEVGADGLLTGPEGTWLDETATPAIEGLQAWRVPASSVLRRRPGHYYWQAYVTGDAASGLEEPVGAVREFEVKQRAGDRGRGRLYPRFGRRGHASFYLSSAKFPSIVDGRRFEKLARKTAARWGLRALRWTSVEAGVRDGFSVAGFSNSVPRGVLGVETDYKRGGRVVERDLALRAQEDWWAGPGYPALDQVDLESVLLHELGHMAGNKRHRGRCANSPMDKALGAGEWWRGSRDKWFAECRRGARAASARALVHRVVRVD
ncbi:MAG TPA: hypothetical protein VFG79_16310 [Solirubrobacter sp.]|nr:hypothetical protein [Solirubrobacter sp.]